MIYSCISFSTKLGNAIGSAVGVLIISGFGYVAGNMEQTAGALAGINLTVNLIPAILLVVAAILLLVLWDKTDKDFDDIRAEVKERNAK